MIYIPRQQAERLLILLRTFPAVPLLESRQCGKSTLARRRGWVVTTGRERRRLSPSIEIIPWAEVAAGHLALF